MKHVFILGAPFSGSTLLTAYLNCHPNVFAAGELERLPQFRRYEHLVRDEPDIYENTCLMCSSLGKVCPIWSPTLLTELEQRQDIIDVQNVIAGLSSERLGKKVELFLDSSKTPDWMRYVASTHSSPGQGVKTFSDASVRAIITTKSPFGYAESMLRRNPMLPVLAGQAWCDITTDALRVASSFGVPVTVVRHEDMQAMPMVVLQKVADFLGISATKAEVVQMLTKQGSEHHSLGGNAFAFSDVIQDLRAVKLSSSWEGLREFYLSSPAEPEIHTRRWIKTLPVKTVYEIASARGIHDLAQLLGYDLSYELNLYFKARSKK